MSLIFLNKESTEYLLSLYLTIYGYGGSHITWSSWIKPLYIMLNCAITIQYVYTFLYFK